MIRLCVAECVLGFALTLVSCGRIGYDLISLGGDSATPPFSADGALGGHLDQRPR